MISRSSPVTFEFLGISHQWGAQWVVYYHDADGKYILKTHHFAIAVLTWMYYMSFYPFSGGWT